MVFTHSRVLFISVIPQEFVIEIQALPVYLTRFTSFTLQPDIVTFASVLLDTLPHLVNTIPPRPHSEIVTFLISEFVVEVTEIAFAEIALKLQSSITTVTKEI